MVADGAALGTGFLDRLSYHSFDGFHHRLVVAMLDHERCKLAVEFAEQHQIAVSHLVKDSNGVSLTIIGVALGVDGAHIRNIASVTDGDVVHVVADVLDEASVTDGDIAQCRVIDATILDKPFSNLDCTFAVAQSCPTVELNTMTATGVKVVSYQDVVPVLCPAIFFLQGLDFLLGQVSVFFHVIVIF